MSDDANEILIIDDDADFAESMADLLELEGHQFAIAGDGSAAIELAKQRHFDLAFVDMKMPGMDGVETLRQLREVQQELRIIVVTGHASPEQLDQAVTAGAFTLLEKPCPVENVIEAAQRATRPQAVLIADDDPDFTEALADSLAKSGRRIVTADTGISALDQLETDEIDVLLLDMRLPKLDGYAVLRALQQQELSVPVVIVTAFPVADDEIRKFDPIVSEILHKPIGPRRLVDALNKAATAPV